MDSKILNKDFFEKTKEKIKEKIKNLYEKVQEFIEENKTISLIIAAILVLILLLVILLSVSVKSSSKSKEKNSNIGEKITLTEDLILPKARSEEDDYILSRNSADKWTTQEAEEWFNIPSEKEIEKLSKTNENIVNDILKATP